MSANAIDLTTLADVKSYMGVTDTSQDVLLQTLITAASQFFMTYCGRNFAAATYTNEKYNGNGGNVLVLNQTPITAVAALSVDGVALAPSAGSALGGFTFDTFALYWLGGRCGAAGFTTGLQNVWVTYTAGYAPIPYDLANACVEMVVKKLRDSTKTTTASRAIAGESITYTNKDIPPTVYTVLELYQRSVPLS